MLQNFPGFERIAEEFPSGQWIVDAATGRIQVRGLPRTDIFTDPGGSDSQVTSTSQHNAATLLSRAPEGDFKLSARVSVHFANTFDAGVLLIRSSKRLWAKLCFEFSPDKEAMVVSVVNRDVSDDANGFVVDGSSVYLRVSRVGDVFAYHASVDGERWTFVRAFALAGAPRDVEIGFEAQSPNGDGCDVVFDNVQLTTSTLEDFRDGH